MIYENPAVAVDCLPIWFDGETSHLIVQKQTNTGIYSLFGSFMKKVDGVGETAEQAIIRTMSDKVGVKITEDQIAQSGIFSKPERDYRMWAISLAHFVFLPYDLNLTTLSGNVEMIPLGGLSGDQLSDMSFLYDHKEIITKSLKYLSRSVTTLRPVRYLLTGEHKSSVFRHLYCSLSEDFVGLSSTNFYRKHGPLGILKVGKTVNETVGRPYELYTFEGGTN